MLDAVLELGTSHGTSKGLVVEWDFAALGGMDRIMAASRKRLAAAGVDLTPALFARFLLGSALEPGLTRLLAAQGSAQAAAPLAAEIQAAYLEDLADALPKPRAQVLDLVKNLAGRGVKIGVMTQLGEDAVKASLLAAGLDDGFVVLPEPTTSVGGFGWDAWRRTPRKMQLADQMGTALVVSGFSAKAALAAGFAVVALPVELTAHQDYSGIDLVADTFSDEIARVILGALRIA